MDKHNKSWHSKNARKKVNAQKRKASVKGKRQRFTPPKVSLSQAEAQYQKAKELEFAKKLGLRRILWLRFISLRGIVIIRKVAHKLSKVYGKRQIKKDKGNKA